MPESIMVKERSVSGQRRSPRRVDFDLYREDDTKKELHALKSDFFTRDKRATEYEDKCSSLTSKVDSLVKFLEEERSLRKIAELEATKKDK
jgi:hypothetical protein